jgi:predicted dehydrogenase
MENNNMDLKYGIIGCGRISRNHIASAIKNKLEIVGLCDIDASQIESLKNDFDVLKDVACYNDYTEMLKKEDLDLVAICTESGKHGSIAIDCINSRINLIIEKPITLSLDEADEIIRLSKENKVKVCACHQNRFNKSIQKIRSAVEKGSFGKLLHGTAHIRWNRGENYYKQAPWRGTWEQDGGALMNQCIHNIDLLRWMMGSEIESVIGLTDNMIHDYIDAEDLGLALIKFKNGSYGVIEGTTNVYPSNLEETLYIFGEKGTVKAGGKSVNLIEEWMIADGVETLDEIKEKYNEDPPNVYGYGHTPSYNDVVEAIRNDRDPYITAKDGRDALELVLSIYKSSSAGKQIFLPINNISTLDFRSEK